MDTVKQMEADAKERAFRVRPIPFRAPMVRAILEGRKTMTRRVLAPRKGLTFGDLIDNGERVKGGYCCTRDQVEEPRYAVGDTLWVREAWRTWVQFDDLPPRDIPHAVLVQYLADDPVSPWDSRYRHARFMPRWASRIDLRVTAVRVERLQRIREEDAIKEGIRRHREPSFDYNEWVWADPRDTFAALWNSIYGPDAWAENPWVAAISFERIKP